MPRLPGIQYTQGVESLGRRDPYGPLRTAEAEAAALAKIPGVIEAWAFADEVSDVNEKVAIYREAVKAKQTELTTQKMIDVKPYEHLDLDYDEKSVVEEDGKKMVPAYMVRKKIWDFEHSQIKADTLDTLKSKKQRDKFFGSTSDLYSTANQGIVKQDIIENDANREAKMTVALDKAVKEGNRDLALKIIDDGVRIGVYDPVKQAIPMRQDVETRLQQAEINIAYTSNDKIVLQDFEDSLRANVRLMPDGSLGPWDLEPKELAQQADRFERKLGRIEDDEVKLRKESEKENSSKELTSAQVQMQETGKPIPWSDAVIILDKLNPGDRKTFLATQNSFRQEFDNLRKEPDQQIMDQLHSEINSLLLPSDIPPQQRLDAVITSINIAQGMNPDTRELTGKVRIHGSQATQLIQKAIALQKSNTDTFEFNRAVDFMYQNLTGGTRQAFTIIDQRGPLSIVLAQMEREMTDAAAKEGVKFDPMKWVDDNLDRYAPDAYKGNISRVINDGYGEYVVMGKVGDQGMEEFDLNASLEKLSTALAIGSIEKRDYIRIARYMNLADKNQIKAKGNKKK